MYTIATIFIVVCIVVLIYYFGTITSSFKNLSGYFIKF